MILIFNPGTDPAHNLSFEEYLLTQRDQDFFLVWRNKPSVIVGRNQNAVAQINHLFTHRYSIPVLRRISGGGTVYHDLGNVNFSFICDKRQTSTRDYRRFLSPVVRFLKHLGVAARLAGESDIMLDSGKISGNAQHHHKGRVLHHGTILFDTRLENLREALSTGTAHYWDNSVDSIRANVTNVRPALEKDLSVEAFMQQFITFFRKEEKPGLQMALSLAEQTKVSELAEHKYKTWEWNLGRSPSYRFDNRFWMPGGALRIELVVRKGLIRDAHFSGAHLTASKLRELCQAVIGQRHCYLDMETALSRVSIDGASALEPYRSLVARMF